MKEAVTNKEYRVNTFEDFIFNKKLEPQLRHLMDNPEKIPPVLCFYGKSGSGKTTFAQSLAKEVSSDITYIKVNEDDNNKIPDRIKKTLLTKNLFGSKRVFIIDELGDATPKLKKSLKTIFDKYSENNQCLFIICLNVESKNLKTVLTPALFSRVNEISFDTDENDMPELKQRVIDKFTMLSIDDIENNLPDLRRIQILANKA